MLKYGVALPCNTAKWHAFDKYVYCVGYSANSDCLSVICLSRKGFIK